jgi:valyl-tRNA synthetase
LKLEGEEQVVNDRKYWVVERTREQALDRAEVVAGGKKFDLLLQDEDHLDTWFSFELSIFDYGVAREGLYFIYFLLTDLHVCVYFTDG